MVSLSFTPPKQGHAQGFAVFILMVQGIADQSDTETATERLPYLIIYVQWLNRWTLPQVVHASFLNAVCLNRELKLEWRRISYRNDKLRVRTVECSEATKEERNRRSSTERGKMLAARKWTGKKSGWYSSCYRSLRTKALKKLEHAWQIETCISKINPFLMWAYVTLQCPESYITLAALVQHEKEQKPHTLGAWVQLGSSMR